MVNVIVSIMVNRVVVIMVASTVVIVAVLIFFRMNTQSGTPDPGHGSSIRESSKKYIVSKIAEYAAVLQHESLITGVLQAEHKQQREQQRSAVQQHPVELSSIVSDRQIHLASRQKKSSETDHENPQNQHHMRWAED